VHRGFRIHALLTASALATVGAAQPVTLPSASASVAPPGPGAMSHVALFYGPAARCQLLYDVNDVGTPTAVWGSLSFRRACSEKYPNPAYAATVTLSLAFGPNAPGAASSTFASNVAGPPPVTVFNGSIALSPSPPVVSWPAAWEAPLLFSVPFFFLSSFGRSLVVELVQTGITPTFPWLPEIWYPDRGTYANVYQPANCRFASGGFAVSPMLAPSVYLGGAWSALYGVVPAGIAGYGVLSCKGPGSIASGRVLPVDLGGLGAPGCAMAVAPDLIFPLLPVVIGGLRMAITPPITIPNAPNLGGLVFYDQAWFADPAANALGVVTTGVGRWSIGTFASGPGSVVSNSGAAASATAASGEVLAAVATVRLN
jgi:hypothetical protein